VPAEKEDQILTATEYLAKRGASQSSQGIKASGSGNQAISVGHCKPGAETSFGLNKFMTPGSYNKFTPKTQNLAPALSANHKGPDHKGKH